MTICTFTPTRSQISGFSSDVEVTQHDEEYWKDRKYSTKNFVLAKLSWWQEVFLPTQSPFNQYIPLLSKTFSEYRSPGPLIESALFDTRPSLLRTERLPRTRKIALAAWIEDGNGLKGAELGNKGRVCEDGNKAAWESSRYPRGQAIARE